ncbi:MAG TPA: EamA family transporter [Thermoleophilaceae bacterium]|nr:EamA family transporter [Thermoleophilaceae bacterium]
MTRPAVIALYVTLVVIWSSTWVAIKIGLEDCPPLLGAGVRFAFAGLVLLAVTLFRRRSLRSDPILVALLALLPFAFTYGLVYWGEQHIPSGLAAVLFGVLPLYTAVLGGLLLADEPMHKRLFAGVLVAIGGLALAFVESLDLGSDDLAWAGALALLLAPLGASAGNVSIKLRAAELDPVVLNGWAMLGGGALLLAVSAAGEEWGEFSWTGESVGSIAYLAIVGSAIAFVGLTVLLRHVSARATSFLAMLLPFGALAFGAALYDEPVTARAAAGAGLVAAGLMLAQGVGLRARARRDDAAVRA